MLISQRLKEAQKFLNSEARSIIDASKKLDGKFSNCIDLIINSNGKVIISGVGKSGSVGRKISSTFVSLGTPSLFLHPLDAFHGDIGIVKRNDVAILISYSGESEETIKLLNYFNNLKIKSIAITGNLNSTISKKCTYTLDASVKKEACHLNLAPTCSTSVAMAIGDSLASICALESGFKPQDFARYHPSGQLHKLNFEVVGNIMNDNNIPTCDTNSSIRDLIIEISKGKLGAVFICDKNKLKWIFTDGDLRRCIINKIDLSSKIKNLNPKEPITIKKSSKVFEASNIMKANKISILPVVESDSTLIGYIKLSQCL